MRRVVVVGASLAGVHAIEGLRDHGYSGEITLVGAEPHLPYDRPPLSKEALRHGPDPTGLLLRAPEWYADRGVELRLGRPARALDPGARRVTLGDGSGLTYDGLVIATGSRPRTVRATRRGRAPLVLRSLNDARDLHARMAPGRHLVVIGGGFIGLEVAATARGIGMRVTVVEVAPVPLTRVLGDEVGAWFRAYHEANGVNVVCGAVVAAVEENGDGGTVVLRDGRVLEADLLVAGVGAEPETGWLDGSGVRLADGVACDSALRTSAPGVVAAGDVARWYNARFDEEMRVEQWTNAIEQGRHAAGTLLGAGDAYMSIPYFWSDQFDAKMRFVGRANASERVHVERDDETTMVALFCRDGVIRGALCVNAPRRLAHYRKAILDGAPWGDVVSA